MMERIVLEADGARIRQVIENLVSNAQRYSPDGVAVLIEGSTEQREDGQWALLSVRDRGPGIASEMLPRLFSRYSSGDTGGALGLGLYLARGIAEAHAGTLTVESTPGKGASFTLALPFPRL
jgi:signal transduction histidine kinase